MQNIICLTWEEHTEFDNLLMKHRFEDLKQIMPRTWQIVVERLSYLSKQAEETGKLLRALQQFVSLYEDD